MNRLGGGPKGPPPFCVRAFQRPGLRTVGTSVGRWRRPGKPSIHAMSGILFPSLRLSSPVTMPLKPPLKLPMTMLGVLVALAMHGEARAQTFTDRSDLLDVQIGRGVSAWAASSVDVNADGFMDLYQPGQVYLGGQDGYTGSLNALAADYTSEFVFGASWADVDDDGFPEAFESVLRGASSRFYANHWGMRLENVAQARGVNFPGLAQGTAFADFNGDGTLDMFIGDDRGGSAVYFGDGEGYFTPSTQNGTLLGRIEKAYGVAAADFDGDGDIDVYIGACDQLTSEKSVNLFYVNRGDGQFDEVAGTLGIDDNRAAWGVVWLDYDNDGWLDLFVANMVVPGFSGRDGTNRLYRNKGDGTFEDVSAAAGVEGVAAAQSFGAAAADFDNDGYVDIYVANALTGGPAQLLHNNGDGTFSDIYEISGFLVEGALPGTFIAQSHFSVTVADFNDDGWIDVFTGAANAPFNRVLMNDGGVRTWLGVRLNQDAPNRDAIGAQVRVFAGGTMQTRVITAGDGFVSQNFGLRTHFGLGSAVIADSVVVRWPDGITERWTELEANQNLTIRRGAGPDSPPVAAEPLTGVMSGSNLRLDWSAGVDPDGNSLLYRPVIQYPDGTTVGFEWTSGLFAEVLFDYLPGGVFNWVVVTRDAATIRRSTSSLTFVSGGVATEHIERPVDLTTRIAPYPNPSTGHFTVPVQAPAGAVVRLEIVDTLGRVVERRNAVSTSNDIFQWAVTTTGLAPGAYVVRIAHGTSHSVSAPVLIIR